MVFVQFLLFNCLVFPIIMYSKFERSLYNCWTGGYMVSNTNMGIRLADVQDIYLKNYHIISRVRQTYNCERSSDRYAYMVLECNYILADDPNSFCVSRYHSGDGVFPSPLPNYSNWKVPRKSNKNYGYCSDALVTVWNQINTRRVLKKTVLRINSRSSSRH